MIQQMNNAESVFTVSDPPPETVTPELLWTILVSEPEVGVVIVDVEGRLHFANPQSAAIWHGVKWRDPRGLTLYDLHTPEFVAERLPLLRRVAHSRKPLIVRHIRRGKQVQSTIWPAATPAGEPHRLLVVTRYGIACAIPDGENPEIVESKFADLGPLKALTPRELEVLALLGHGQSVPEIARLLHRSPKTIERHKTSAAKKLSARNWVELAQIASQAGLEVRDAALRRFDDSAKARQLAEPLPEPERTRPAPAESDDIPRMNNMADMDDPSMGSENN
jgi:DNA-binding CsgD family transcriptional regulator